MARSVAHQHRLRSLGYPAVLPTPHCVGYAVDVEMAWFRRFRGRLGALACLLLERQDSGDANIIDEGQVWHVCVNPAAPRGFVTTTTRTRSLNHGGIALIVGRRADRATFRRMVATLARAATVEEILVSDHVLAGTQRLRIVDR